MASTSLSDDWPKSRHCNEGSSSMAPTLCMKLPQLWMPPPSISANTRSSCGAICWRYMRGDTMIAESPRSRSDPRIMNPCWWANPVRAVIEKRRELLRQGNLTSGHRVERMGHKSRVLDQISVQRRAAQHFQGVYRPLQVRQHEPDHVRQRRKQRQHIPVEPVTLDHPRQPTRGQIHRPAGQAGGRTPARDRNDLTQGGLSSTCSM